MARGTFQSLCVAEYTAPAPSKQTAWRTVADLVPSRSGKSRFFPVSEGDSQHVTHKTPVYGEVAVLDWSDDKKLPSGEPDIRVCSRTEVVEVLEPREFKDVHLEDADAVRALLKQGFSFPENTKTAFSKGQVSVAIVIPSITGYRRALVIRDKSKLFFESECGEYVRGWLRAYIEPTPEDPKRFMESMDIVELDKISEITYKRDATSVLPRKFLAEEAPLVAKNNQFIPYSTREFAPAVLKRALTSSTKNYPLYSGRQLTKADMAEIFDCIEDSLKDEDTWSTILRVNDPAIATQLAEGIRAMLPKIREDVQQDNKAMTEIRSLLFGDETIRKTCIQMGKEEWLADSKAERAQLEKELEEIRKQAGKEQEKKAALEKSRAALEKQLAKMQKELTDREAEAKNVSAHFQSALANYRHDIAKLMLETGCPTGALPFTVSGAQVECEKEDVKALSHNLSAFLSDTDASSVATFLTSSIAAGFHIGVPGEYADMVADAISIAHEGCTASIVAKTDDNCSFADLQRAILQANTDVVLVEGMLGCEQDYRVLALARHCYDKLIVFSLDDAMNKDKISSTVFHRVALVDNLAMVIREDEHKHWELSQGFERPVACIPAAWWPQPTNPSVNELFQQQKRVMGIE